MSSRLLHGFYGKRSAANLREQSSWFINEGWLHSLKKARRLFTKQSNFKIQNTFHIEQLDKVGTFWKSTTFIDIVEAFDIWMNHVTWVRSIVQHNTYGDSSKLGNVFFIGKPLGITMEGNIWHTYEVPASGVIVFEVRTLSYAVYAHWFFKNFTRIAHQK